VNQKQFADQKLVTNQNKSACGKRGQLKTLLRDYICEISILHCHKNTALPQKHCAATKIGRNLTHYGRFSAVYGHILPNNGIFPVTGHLFAQTYSCPLHKYRVLFDSRYSTIFRFFWK
jgi:hypothetical protein